MKVEIYVNGKEVEIELTSAQVAQIKKSDQKITDRIKSYEDACEYDGIKPLKLSDFNFLPEKDRVYHYYDHRQVVIKRALNEGWEADHSNPDQEKYYVWYKWVGSGVGFSFDDSICAYSGSDVGARHEFKSEELSKYYAKQFINEVNMCFTLNNK